MDDNMILLKVTKMMMLH